MVNGILIYNAHTQRPALQLPDSSAAMALHCGDRLLLCLAGFWVPVRLELADSWYFVTGSLHLDFVPGIKARYADG